VPIKRYGRSVRGTLPKPNRRPLSSYQNPVEREQVRRNRFARLSPARKAAAIIQEASKKAKREIERLRRQRLSVLGAGDHVKQIGEAQAPSAASDGNEAEALLTRGAPAIQQ